MKDNPIPSLPPHSGLIVFDGYCNLCNGIVRFLIKIDRKQRLKFTNFESETWKSISDSVPQETDSIVFVKQGHYYFQSEAVIEILKTLGYPWRAVMVFKVIPFKIREAIYKLIARTRYKVFGKRDTCQLPSDKVKNRFLS